MFRSSGMLYIDLGYTDSHSRYTRRYAVLRMKDLSKIKALSFYAPMFLALFYTILANPIYAFRGDSNFPDYFLEMNIALTGLDYLFIFLVPVASGILLMLGVLLASMIGYSSALAVISLLLFLIYSISIAFGYVGFYMLNLIIVIVPIIEGKVRELRSR